jgi:protocatechuate 3,4-dioxygenase beta subunit
MVAAAALLVAAIQAGLPSTLEVTTPQEPGVPLTINGLVRDAAGHPAAGAMLHVYQTDSTGRYTRERPMDEPHARLNGRLRADSAGRFVIHTIRPGGYPQAIRLGDRERHIPAHVHIDVQAAGTAERKLQVVFSDDPNLTDSYWIDWAKKLREPIVTVQPAGRGVSVELVITLDPAN